MSLFCFDTNNYQRYFKDEGKEDCPLFHIVIITMFSCIAGGKQSITTDAIFLNYDIQVVS